jgi:ethanolamine utilization microcompartment shell protein EutS
MTTAAVAGSGTLSYTKKGLVKNPANKTISGNLYVDGSTALTGASTLSGATTISGALTTTGSNTHSGTDNFTGTLQINGAVGYVLTEVLEETMTSWSMSASGNYDSIWTSTAFTKPSDEIWVFETDFHYSGVSGYAFSFGFRYSNQTVYTGTYKVIQQHYTVGNNGTQIYHQTNRWVEGTGTTLTALTLKVDTNAGTSSLMTMFNSTYSFGTFVSTSASTVIPSKFRIYKYKTA